MTDTLTVTYLFHSGFLVAVEDVLLVFDYWRGENSALPAKACISEKDFERFRRVLVFVTHSHVDHFDPIIYDWDRAKYHIEYIISDDLPQGIPGRRMRPGDEADLDGITVRAFDSTDLGVS